MSIRAGDRVQFTKPFNFKPHAEIRAGETGTVVSTDEAFGEQAVEVKLDKLHRGLSEWMNTVLVVGTALEVLKDLIG